jgi:hypothetical protein
MCLIRAYRPLPVDPYVVVKLNGASFQILQCQHLNGVPVHIVTVKREMLHFRVTKAVLLILDTLVLKMAVSLHVYELNGQI